MMLFRANSPGFSFESICTVFWGKFTLIIEKETNPTQSLSPSENPYFLSEHLNFFPFKGWHSEGQCFRWTLCGRLMLSPLKIFGVGTPFFCMVQRIVVSDPTHWQLLWYKYFNNDNVWIGEVETEFKWFLCCNDR